MTALDITLRDRTTQLATELHAGQWRKYTGEPFVQHPLRVAWILERFGAPVYVQIAGLLHDTVEDTEATIHTLYAEGFLPPESIRMVDTLTRREGENYMDFIKRAVNDPDPWTALVKRSDLLDNMATLPPGLSMETRYIKALQAINVALAKRPPLPRQI
jgi:(p)ppGpp synthase/HD superfamily hydrolase